MGSNRVAQWHNIGENPSVILYTYVNAISNRVAHWHNIGENPSVILYTNINAIQLHQTRGTRYY